jgi:SAM-dependent methyltransferase
MLGLLGVIGRRGLGARLMSAIQEIAGRYARYCDAKISIIISPHDDMFAVGHEGAMDHYMSVGRSAIDVIVSVLVAAGNPTIRTILDLPCGGGRVTRHLCALFPECKIYVSDLDKQKEEFVSTAMNAIRAESNPDFIGDPARQYDLIFVGSLLTHLTAAKVRRAVKWFIWALAPNGLLILTTHGRRHNYLQQNVIQFIDRKLWSRAQFGYKFFGFGYAAYPDIPSYGVSTSSPSWIMKLVENEPGVKILGFHEAEWEDHQDVLVVQKHDVKKWATIKGG